MNTTIRCPSCHAFALVSLVVKIVEDRWHTSESLACDGCSLRQEADGERLSDAAEEAVLSAYGTWAVFLEDRRPNGPKLLRMIAQLLNLPLSEVRSRVVPGTVVPLAVGSKLAIDALAAALRGQGADVAVGEVAGADPSAV